MKRLRTEFFKMATNFKLNIKQSMQDMEILTPQNSQKLRDGAERLGIAIITLGLSEIPQQQPAYATNKSPQLRR